MLVDNHVHLERGPYTLGWLEKFLQQADRRGVAELGFTEHMYRFVEARPALYNQYIAPRQTEHLHEYLELMVRAKQKGWPVKVGLEVDYIPGKEVAIEQILQGLPLDFVIGSVHWLGDWCFDSSAASWAGRDVNAAYQAYYATLAQAAESGLFDVIGHPGNIAYFGHWADPDVMTAAENEFLRRCQKQNGVTLEVNTGGLLKQAHSLFPRVSMLQQLCQYDFAISGFRCPPSEGRGACFSATQQLLSDWVLPA